MISLHSGRSTAVDAMERQLRASKLFQGLSAALTSELAASALRQRILRGEHLWRDGDEASRFVLITVGLVKIVQRTADQTESIVGLFGPREAVGTVALLRRGRYPASAVAASDHVEVLKLDPKPVFAAMDTDPSAARAMNGALLDQTRALHEKISVMSAGAVSQRLATQLLTLAERFGDEHADGTLSVPLVLSRSELACLVGARVETTIRVLAGWQKAGVVDFARDGVTLRVPEQLRLVARGKE